MSELTIAWKEQAWTPMSWAGITLVAGIGAYIAILPNDCDETDECKAMNAKEQNIISRYAVCALLTSLVLEIVALRLTWRSAKTLVGIIRGIEYTFVPPLLLCIAFFLLILENFTIMNLGFVHAAAPGVGSEERRPVFSIIPAEWLVNVPILLTLCAMCALGRPMSEVSRPLIVTNLYIILAWCAYFVHNPTLRWAMIALAFTLYAWASYDMVFWVARFRENMVEEIPAHKLRCGLTFGLILVFFVYGIVYLGAMTGYLSSTTEMFCYITMNVTVKLVILLAFVGIRSSQFYDLVCTLLTNKRMPFERQIAIKNDFGDVQHVSTLPLLQ